MLIKTIYNLMRNIIAIPFKYKKSISYVFKKQGIKGVLNFLFVKYNVCAEGGEMDLCSYLYRFFPHLAGMPCKIDLEHTTICNRKCLLCEHTYWNEESRHITLEQVKHVVNQLQGLKWINVTGVGSNFLNPDFLKIIEFLRSRNISVSFVDEMELIDEEKARRIIELGVNSLWVSMDAATGETYEKVKKGNNFKRVIENIKTLARLKKEYDSPFPSLSFRFIVNTMNYHEMPLMPGFLKELGCMGEGSKLEYAGILKFKEIEEYYISELEPELKERTVSEAQKYKIDFFFSHLEENSLPDMCKCTAWTIPNILVTGHVLPCDALIVSNRRKYLMENSLGNVYENSFSDIWNSERYKKMRGAIPGKKEKVPLLCRGCRVINTKNRENRYGVCQDI